MTWQQRIVTILNLTDKSPKIISDTIGVLSSQDFKTYLRKNNIEVIYSDTSSKFLATVNNKENVIYITSKLSIPQFLKSYYEYKTFDYSQLPINGNLSVLKTYNADDIVTLCNYIFASNPHSLLSKSNSNELLVKAKKFEKLNELQSVKNISK